MRFTVETMITMTPRPQIYVNAVKNGQPAVGKILMHRNDGKKLEITKIRYEDPEVEITAVPADPEDEAPKGTKPVKGDVWLIARASEKIGTGNHSIKVWLTTNHPKLTELEIPVTFRIKSLISAHPAQIRLWIQDVGGGPRGTLFRLIHNGGEAFEVTKIEVGDPELIDASAVTDGAAKMHSIRVEVNDAVKVADLGSTGKATELVITTSDPKQPEIRVPVTVMQRQVAKRPGAGMIPTDVRRTSPIHKLGDPNIAPPEPLPTGTPGVEDLG